MIRSASFLCPWQCILQVFPSASRTHYPRHDAEQRPETEEA